MAQTSINTEQQIVEPADLGEPLAAQKEGKGIHERPVAKLRLLWDQRRFLLRVTGYGLVVVTLVAFLIPKRYESTARLMPPDSQSGSGTAILAALTARTGSDLGILGSDLLGFKSSGALFVGILSSRTVRDRLIDRFDLKKVYGVRLYESARNKLGENTSISEDRKSGIIAVTVTDQDPQRAAAMGRMYVEELNRLVAELSTSAAHRERLFLEDRLNVVKQELDTAAKEFSQFASKNVVIDIKEQGRAMVEAAAILQGQVIAAQSELEGLKQIYTDNNVRVRSARARIAELQRQLERFGGTETDKSAKPGQEGGSLYPSIRKLPLLGVTYADLYRRTKVAETVYETLTKQYELAKVQEAKEIPIVKVLDVANVPEKKSFPPRLLIMFMGAFLSLSLGVVWVLGSARWREMDSQDPRKALAQEVLTTLRAQVSGESQNGSRLGALTSKVRSRLNWLRKQQEKHG